MRFISVVAVVLLSRWVTAGEIILRNDDRLSGELLEIKQDHIVWESDTFGVVEFPKKNVKSLSSDIQLKVEGTKDACYLLGLDHLDALMRCGDGADARIRFASLKNVVVYEQYDEIAHEYEGRLEITGTDSEGNRDRRDWLVDIDVTLRHFEYRHTIGLKYDAESENDEELEEEYEATYSIDWFISPKTFLFADTSARSDETRDILERYTAGSGLGYQFWDTSRSAWSVEGGGEYIFQRIDEEPSVESEDIVSWRVATVYRYVFPRSIELNLRADYLQSARDRDDWEADTELSFNLPIGFGITANARYELDYDNTPAEDRRRRDATLRFGLGYEW